MKRILLSILLTVALHLSMGAQVILLDVDENPHRSTVQGEMPFIPILGVTYDQYAPIGDGLLLLCGLGGAYLLKNKRKKNL